MAGDPPVVESWGTRTILFRRDNDKLLISQITQYDAQPGAFQQDEIFKNNDHLVVADRLDANLTQFQDSTNLSVSISSESLGGTKAQLTDGQLFEGLNDYGLCFGYLGYFKVGDYLNEPDGAQVELASQDEWTTVFAKSKYGSLRLWLDSAAGYLPRKIELLKEGSDLMFSGGMKLSEVNLDGGEEPPSSDRSIKRIFWRADDVVLENKSGVSYIKKVKLIRETVPVTGAIMKLETSLEVVDVSFDPVFVEGDYSPQLTIPRGHPVTAVAAEHLTFEWNGSRAAPVVQTVNREPIKQNRAPMLILIFVNVGVAASLLAIYLVRRFHKAN